MNAIRLPAREENLEKLVRFVADLLTKHGFPKERALEIEMSAEEVLVNIIRYAYSEGTPGDVEIRGSLITDDECMLEFEDSGAPFDPTSLPPPDVNLPLSRRKAGGLGIFFVRKMANEVRYLRERDRNILTLLVRKSRGIS
jgi:anti-sigma regulatory factor (Ser/Thr protein kinase)